MNIFIIYWDVLVVGSTVANHIRNCKCNSCAELQKYIIRGANVQKQ